MNSSKKHKAHAVYVLSCAFLFFALSPRLWAGGSGLNVLVVVNVASSNSVQLGNYYCEQRGVPPQNYLRIDWPYGNTDWDAPNYTNLLLNPLLSFLQENGLTNQIDDVVLSMDIPYRVTGGDANNSTTSSLFYGFKLDPNPPCSLAADSESAYAGCEGAFRENPPLSGPGPYFLTMMITETNLASAEMLVDQGVRGDSTFPTQTVYLAKSDDYARNVRFYVFDNAIFNTRVHGDYSLVRTNLDALTGMGVMLGAESGYTDFSLSGDSFVPGSMADNLTSYGGYLFDPIPGQLDTLAFLQAGAAGTYGTVDEPCNYLQKFPIPMDYFWQARGFSLAECYYMSVTNPYQGVMVGEPLSAPFALPGAGEFLGLTAEAPLRGTTNLSLKFSASDALHPLQQVNLFVDGAFAGTLTNVAPAPGNDVSVTISNAAAGTSYGFNYVVAPGDTVRTISSNLALVLNGITSLTQVLAAQYGDRIQLQSLNPAVRGAQLFLSVTSSPGTAKDLTTFIHASRTNFLDTVAYGYQSYEVDNTNSLNPGDYLQIMVLETNNTRVSLAVTNTVAGGNYVTLVEELLSAINSSPALQGPGGLNAQDFTTIYGPALFNLYANSPGWDAAAIQVAFHSSPDMQVSPSGTQVLEANLSDLQPRDHVYITAGVTNLPLTFAFNTATQASGFHQLAAVAYEGSSVRTQTRATQSVQIQNGTLSATLTALYGGSNTVVGATLQFSVMANTAGTIELFSTGGLLAAATNVTSAVFSIPSTNLDVGLHPVYAVVIAPGGQQYRTQTLWIRLVDTPDGPFKLSITNPPLTLSWPATAGRTYDILSTTNLTHAFQVIASVTPSNSVAQWTAPSTSGIARFYSVKTAD